jgi:CAAX protease family protein
MSAPDPERLNIQSSSASEPNPATPAEDSGPVLPLWPTGSMKERAIGVGKFLAYAALFIFLFLATQVLLRPLLRGPYPPGPLKAATGAVFQALCALVATAIMAALEGRRFTSFGLRDRHKVGRFLSGALVGFMLLTLLLLGLRIGGHFYFGSPEIHGSDIPRFALIYIVLFLSVGVSEETLFRGYPLFTLSRSIGFWPAAIVLSGIFGWVHSGNPGESRFGEVAAGLFGLVIAYSILRTKTLWWAIGFHFMWDYSQSFIYGVADSGALLPGHLLHAKFSGPAWITGGSVGPEGSYFILLVLAVLALVIHVTLPGRKAEQFTTEAQRPSEV